MTQVSRAIADVQDRSLQMIWAYGLSVQLPGFTLPNELTNSIAHLAAVYDNHSILLGATAGGALLVDGPAAGTIVVALGTINTTLGSPAQAGEAAAATAGLALAGEAAAATAGLALDATLGSPAQAGEAAAATAGLALDATLGSPAQAGEAAAAASSHDVASTTTIPLGDLLIRCAAVLYSVDPAAGTAYPVLGTHDMTASPAVGESLYVKDATGNSCLKDDWTQLAAPGATDAFTLPFVARDHLLQVTVGTINTNVIVSLDGSLDGTNWFEMAAQLQISYNGTYFIAVNSAVPIHVRGRFVSETGGTTATIDFVYRGAR